MTRPLFRYRILWRNRKDREAQVKILFYIVNLFMFMCGIIFGIFFFHVSMPMFLINCYFMLLNVYLYYLLEQNEIAEFINLTLLQLWLFLICSVLFIGWDYGFQQYIFCILCIFFLPFYLPEQQKRKRYHRIGMGLALILTYFILYYLCELSDLNIGIEGTQISKDIMFGINSFITAIAIMTFSVFSTAVGVDDRKRLTRKADFDQLTGLYNRYAINQILENYVNSKRKIYIAIADIDYFKKINDTYGHDVGDKTLKKVAEILVRYSKDMYHVGRWGGEEFLFIAPDRFTYEEFLNRLDDIRKYFNKSTFNFLGNKLNLTLSFGVSRYDGKGKVVNSMKEADEKLYKAKETGRNRIIS